MALNPQQQHVGQLLYTLAVQRGIPPPRAREFVSAALAESGLRPDARNPSGATGLFQLLSSGYQQRARQLGGLTNPRANALAILPSYQRYWQQHPHAAPGEAGRDVERSGAGAGFYSRGLSQLGNLGGGLVGSASVGPAAQQAPAAPVGPQQTGMALLQALQAGPQHGDYGPVYQAIQQRIHAAAQGDAQGVAEHIARSTQPGSSAPLGRVTLRLGADRPGVRTSAAVLQFVRKIAGLARTPLTIGTGTQHSQMTVNGRVSDHWSGHAADIPATGYELVHLGRLALIAAGANPRWAMKQTGGLYTVNGHQIIFATHIGGDHTNHLHVSAH